MTVSRGQNSQEHVGCQRFRVGSKKSAFSPAQPRRAKTRRFRGQGRESLATSRRVSPLFDARSVLVIREHGKRARTPLAAFFNRPQRVKREETYVEVRLEGKCSCLRLGQSCGLVSDCKFHCPDDVSFMEFLPWAAVIDLNKVGPDLPFLVGGCNDEIPESLVHF